MAALLSKSGSVEGVTDCFHSWGGSKLAFPNSVSVWDFSDQQKFTVHTVL